MKGELVRPLSRANVASLKMCWSVQLRSLVRTRCTCALGFLERQWFKEINHKNSLAEWLKEMILSDNMAGWQLCVWNLP